MCAFVPILVSVWRLCISSKQQNHWSWANSEAWFHLQSSKQEQEEEDAVDETILSIKILQSPQIDPSSSHSHNWGGNGSLTVIGSIIPGLTSSSGISNASTSEFPWSKYFSRHSTHKDILPETYNLGSLMGKITFGVSFQNVGRLTMGELGLPGMTLTEVMKNYHVYIIYRIG